MFTLRQWLPIRILLAKLRRPPICLYCGSGEEMAEHLLPSCPKWAAERRRHFNDSIDIDMA